MAAHGRAATRRRVQVLRGGVVRTAISVLDGTSAWAPVVVAQVVVGTFAHVARGA